MSKTQKNNVIWIFSDQQPGYALGCAGDPNACTPNLDTLAGQGLYFPHAVSGAPLCCPFRGSLLTSRYSHECVPGHEYQLNPEQKTIAHAFHAGGYETAYFGKWHLDGFKEKGGRAVMHAVPENRRGGFKTWMGYENNNSQWDTWIHGRDWTGKEVSFTHLPGYETDQLTDLFIKYLDAKATDKAPFFAVLSVQPPHNPYLAPAEYMKKYNPKDLKLRPNVPLNSGDLRSKACYPDRNIEARARQELAGTYAMIENLDWNVGRIRQKLLESGLNQHTHVIFFSDHGDMHGSHGYFLKPNPYHEAVGIPMMIGGEQHHGYNRRGCGVREDVLNHVDIAPTSLGLCGLPVPGDMRGHDYSYLKFTDREQKTAPDSAFIQSVIPTGHAYSINQPWRGVVTREGWKYVCLPGMSWHMYNLREDPYEQVNLAHDSFFSQERKKLIQRLKQWVADTGDQFSVPKD